MTSGPRVFVSSTIRDFEDLRSALKYELEGLGYRVLLSELADFEKPIDPNAYDACFEAIRESDVYVLLVGGRRGGWYDKTQGVSITQAEYREAYEEARRGNLTVIPCVRKPVWDRVRSLPEGTLESNVDRTASDGEEEIGGAPDLEDPAHVRRFLAEIARAEEIEAAVEAGESGPKANWVHVFSSFSDLMEILRVALRLKAEVSAAVVLDLAAEELIDFAQQIVTRRKGRLATALDFLPELVRELDMSSETYLGDVNRRVVISRETNARLGAIVIELMRRMDCTFVALERATYLASLSEYDRETRTVRASPLQKACMRALKAVRLVSDEGFRSSWSENSRGFLTESSGSREAAIWEVKCSTILLVVAGALQYSRAWLEVENLLLHLKHGRSLDPDPTRDVPVTPIRDQAAELTGEHVGRDELVRWIGTRGYVRRR